MVSTAAIAGIGIGAVLLVIAVILLAVFMSKSKPTTTPPVTSAVPTPTPIQTPAPTLAPTTTPAPTTLAAPIPTVAPTTAPPPAISIISVSTNVTNTPSPVTGAVYLPFMDMAGSDMAGSPITGVSSQAACLSKCVATGGCAGAVYGPSLQYCWLKSSMSTIGFSFAPQRVVAHAGGFQMGNALSQGLSLLNTSFISSPDYNWVLLMQSDNNACIYNLTQGVASWATNTAGQGTGNPGFLQVQPDSGLWLRAGNKTLWSSGTTGGTAGPYTATLQNGGVLVVSAADGHQVWTSATGALVTNPPATPAPTVIATFTGPNKTLAVTKNQANVKITIDVNDVYTQAVVATSYSVSFLGPPPDYKNVFFGAGTYSDVTFTGYNAVTVLQF